MNKPDEKEILALSELTMREGESYLVVEYIASEDEVNIMEVDNNSEDILWSVTPKHNGVKWVREILDSNDVDYVYTEL